MRECARALARFAFGGIRCACGGFRRMRMAMKIVWEAGGESCGT